MPPGSSPGLETKVEDRKGGLRPDAFRLLLGGSRTVCYALAKARVNSYFNAKSRTAQGVCGLLGATKISCCAMYHAEPEIHSRMPLLFPQRSARSLLLNGAPVNGIKRPGGANLELGKFLHAMQWLAQSQV
jgi:hypothetical protein